MYKGIFRDKTALVTGSSRGIGAAIATAFAEAGADVAINFRKAGGSSEKKARELSETLSALGRKTPVVQADIGSKDDVKRLVAQTVEKTGRLDYLILNAARTPFKPIERLLEREMRHLVETNYMGNIFCVQESLSELEKTGGKIVFISSLGSRFYNPSYPLGSMKAAMESVVRDLSESLRPRGVAVNGVCAGIVKTDVLKVLRQQWEELARMPEEVFIEPREVADVVLFLCSPAARGILGHNVVIDRGIGNSLFH